MILFAFGHFEGYYEQYDTVIYPEKNKGYRYLERIGDFVFGSSSNISANQAMRQKCLMTYLDELQNDLKHWEFRAICAVECVVDFAMKVVTCLTTQRIAHGDKATVWIDEKLIVVSPQQ